MITKEGLEKRYEVMSNSELMEIIDHKFEYTDLAVSVAIQELAKRNVSEEDVAKHKNKIVLEFQTAVEKNFIDDLTIGQKLLFFYIFWLPWLTSAIRRNFASDGFVLKYRQAGHFALMGMISCFVSVFTMLLLDLHSIMVYIFFALLGGITLHYDLTVRRKKRLKVHDEQFSQVEDPDDSDADHYGNANEGRDASQ